MLRPEMTVSEVLQRWPHTRLNLQSGRWDVDPERDGHLTLAEYAARLKTGFKHDFTLCWLNNCAVLFDAPDGPFDGDPTLVYYEQFHRHATDVSPERDRPQVVCELSPEGLGLRCRGGLPHQRWVLSDGLNAVRLQQVGPTLEMLSAFQRTAGMSSERLFDHGFLDARVADRRHAFDQVTLTPYGYDNHRADDPQERSSGLLCDDRMWFTLAAPGQTVGWVLDDSRLRPWQYHGARQLTRHGWQADEQCVLFQIVDTRADKRQERPRDYEGFSDEEARDYIGTEWQEVAQGQTAKTITCWVAMGARGEVRYSVTPVRHEPGSADYIAYESWTRGGAAQEGFRHAFEALGEVELVVGLGSTRDGALAELAAGREGSQRAGQRQRFRFSQVAARSPRLQLPSHPELSEALVQIPLFLESLKTGFALMRSRPHDGAVTGGWDQLMIASPMARLGDPDMVPRYLEHWLHQFQLDGQIYHITDFDLSPALLFRRWDLDDFMYLIVAAQWVARTGDEAMLQRLAPKCTHMLRVMLRQADPRLGLIVCRGIFSDWPPLDSGRKGLTYPATETGLWYEALRWWEGLACRLGESQLGRQLRITAERIRSCYLELFFDAETGAICDAVFPDTLTPLRTYTSWAMTPWQGCFGHELLDGREPEVAAHLLAHQLDLSFPGIRGVATDSAYPSAYERLHWPLWDHLMAKAMRRGNHRRGLAAVLEVMGRQYRWFHCAREMVDMWRDMTPDQVSEGAYWFGWSSTGWSEALLSGAVGIWEEPGGLVFVPADQAETVHLENLPYRGGTWDICVDGVGAWVSRFAVDGQEQAGVCKVPEPFLGPGRHRLHITRSEQPPTTPFVIDSVGLRLLGSRCTPAAAHLQLAGPGRAWVRFWAPAAPVVTDGGVAVACRWAPGDGIGWVMLERGEEPREVVITAAARLP